MKKTLLCGWLAGLLSAVMCRAGDYTFTYTTENSQTTITGISTNASGAVVIPATLGNYPVTAIARAAFLNRTGITGLTFASATSVTNLGPNAFQGCAGLTTVALPASLSELPAGLFYGCSGLATVTLPSSVTNIGPLAFAHCASLGAITLPSGLTSLGESAFLDCRSLTALSLPAGLTSIPNQLCYGCVSLATVEIPAGVTSLGDGAFYHCQSLASVAIPTSVTRVGQDAFQGCLSLGTVSFNSPVAAVGGRAFYECSALNTLYFNAGAGSLGEAAFGDCAALAGVYFLGAQPALESADAADLFAATESATVYYFANTGSWDTAFGGVTATTWKPTISALSNNNTGFALTVTWISGQTVRAQAASSLDSANWADLGAGTIVDGTCQFTDPDAAQYPQRFYRVASGAE